MDLKVAIPEEATLIGPAESKLSMVQAMKIDSPIMYEAAGDELRTIKGRIKSLDSERDGLVRPLNETVAKINALFKRPIGLLQQAELAMKGAMLTYQQEEERKAAEARRAAEEAARKERERIEAEAAAARAKADAEAAELRRKAEEAAAKGNVTQAAKLESKAESRETAASERVAELTMQSAAVTYAPVSTPVVRASGTSIRSTWKAECTDKAKLVAFVAANPQFLNLIDINQSGLSQLAKATKGAIQIDGARFWEDKQLAARAA